MQLLMYLLINFFVCNKWDSLRGIFVVKGPQQMLRTHRSPKAYFATLWLRWLVFSSFFLVIEHWWNEIDRGKPKYSEKNLYQCNFVYHKSHMGWPGICFSFPFYPLIHFVPLNPSLLLHVTYVPYYCPYTTNTTQTCPWRDSNPQSQQANGRRPTP